MVGFECKILNNAKKYEFTRGHPLRFLASESKQTFWVSSVGSLDLPWQEFEPKKLLLLLFEPVYRGG